ncbi:unnamed protein product [Triticum turgidum subsp. durum]|uniref:Neprosin PEP catalytic domain-containing protein n=1 Tax=Triticum turgidum subsp. durum TaxID=4567 RepID=A0A9R0ZYQ7_TRITD|nr:unnamed protein product [Triticum turgidum subsp. durum]
MAWSFHFVPLLLLLLLSNTSAVATSGHSAGNATARLRPGREPLKHRRIRALLGRLNKPTLKTIKSPDGDLIDCVPSHLQPAFDHPMLKGQKPLDPPERPKNYNSTIAGAVVVQAWHATGEACPEGTVALRRTTEKDLLRASSLRRYGRKPPRRTTRRDSTSSGHEANICLDPLATGAASLDTLCLTTRLGHRNISVRTVVRLLSGSAVSAGSMCISSVFWSSLFAKTCPAHWQHAVGYVNSEKYYGARASVNVWSPRIDDPSEFSLSQIWVISGSFGHDLNTIEAGWQVSPELYGDSNARFFTYWTTDAYQETGCYNHNCRGFVQTTNKIAIGAAITPQSVYNGRQFDINLMIWKVVDWDNSIIRASGLKLLADHPGCYDIQGGSNGRWGTYFYYGGPGRNVKCP